MALMSQRFSNTENPSLSDFSGKLRPDKFLYANEYQELKGKIHERVIE